MSDLIRVLIADDHYVVRQGLAALLVPRNGFEVVGQAANGREVIQMARSLKPSVIVMDMLMPGMNGIDAIEHIKKEDPDARILILASFGESQQVSDAVRAGALGYLLKDSSPDDLFHALRSVDRGNLVLPQALASKMMRSEATGKVGELTEREVEVLRLLTQGQANLEIARNLHISVTTVRSHV
ncbi:MAG: response regulator transcription factor, partial [Polyangiaceae bacterium]|nr:response regulator transcription factor [Polyangiaceae bacterium]